MVGDSYFDVQTISIRRSAGLEVITYLDGDQPEDEPFATFEELPEARRAGTPPDRRRLGTGGGR